jgi:hypothetical protein
MGVHRGKSLAQCHAASVTRSLGFINMKHKVLDKVYYTSLVHIDLD